MVRFNKRSGDSILRNTPFLVCLVHMSFGLIFDNFGSADPTSVAGYGGRVVPYSVRQRIPEEEGSSSGGKMPVLEEEFYMLCLWLRIGRFVS